ncbi:PREDICTED: uncharacterized protein LOC108575463 [Habropoda laboriosa]|uniref:uncharacterized protein LOC108575463 n=1 Tax=Habropoda laboriosa TaxID=597456 RepID=UPI00083DB3C0|nr:PREDICTED: uncharacterized protein LOC108575463 [Habropoda laboriosa]
MPKQCVDCRILHFAVLSTKSNAASSDSNPTKVVVEEEDDESLPEITLEEFKERYRRLIPYMTFYVANNYVNAQTASPQTTSAKEYQSSPLVRKPPQPFTRINTVPRRENNYRTNVQNQDKKFVPSVQYDPRNVGADSEYFTPVRYGTKISYDEYSTPYQLYHDLQSMYPEISTVASQQISRNGNRYYTNVRLSRPYTTNGRDHPPRKQAAKPIQGNIREDYLLDYNARPTSNVALNYPIKDVQGHRQASPYSNLQALDSVPGKQNPIFAQPPRNPNLNLQQIAESFHLSERLPEMLSKDNIDNSLKTLVEILNILHNTKKEEFPQIQAPPLTQLAPSPPRLPQKATNFKVRQQTRPKVITETRFQATPNPLYLTDDPERYKMTYEEETKPKPPPQSSYSTNSLSNKLVEYYVPVVHETPTKEKEPFLPTVRPETNEGPTDHSYAITEDLRDDVLQEERFTPPPVTTKSPVYSYTEPNRVSSPKQSAPQTSLKYGATQGEANVDYPAYSKIPYTNFSCKEQRYKGFFGDPDTGCQVWHYCDLNGGKSSFLCPNGTIFSQVALTCDWWFNVKCETTTQLYVLNERLYKYILPIMPKFPEDFTGPEVDRYLEIKFKEMEAKLKEKKLKKQQEEKEKLKEKQQTQQKEDE